MRLLVTGGCGFIGSNFLRFILEHYRPAFVTNVDVLVDPTALANTADLAGVHGERYEFLNADIADASALEALMRKHSYYAILNFAAQEHVYRSINSPQNFIHTNVAGTGVLLECAQRHGVQRFVQISSSAVYGPAQEGVRFAEDAPLAPQAPAAASKASADLLVQSFYQTHGQETVVLRAPKVYGPRQGPERLVPRTILRALRDEPVALHGGGRDVRDWLHVEDFCRAIFAVLLEGRPGAVYNVGADSVAQDAEVVRRILTQLGKPESLIWNVEEPAPPQDNPAVEWKRLHRELGWKPIHPLEKGLSETVEWYVRNPQWWEPLRHRLEQA